MLCVYWKPIVCRVDKLLVYSWSHPLALPHLQEATDHSTLAVFIFSQHLTIETNQVEYLDSTFLCWCYMQGWRRYCWSPTALFETWRRGVYWGQWWATSELFRAWKERKPHPKTRKETSPKEKKEKLIQRKEMNPHPKKRKKTSTKEAYLWNCTYLVVAWDHYPAPHVTLVLVAEEKPMFNDGSH